MGQRRLAFQLSPDGNRFLEQVVAAGSLVAISLQRISIGPGIMPRHAVAILLLPVWLPILSRYRGASALLSVGLFAGIGGLVLSQVTAIDHPFSQKQAITTTFDLIGFLACVCIVLWARKILSIRIIALFFGMGLAINSAISVGPLGVTNPLKFGWAMPICIALLAIFQKEQKLVRQFGALALLAVLAVISDARSLLAICVLAALLVLWQLRPRSKNGKVSWFGTAAIIACLGGITYFAGSGLLVGGYLGGEAQARSVGQLNASGSLILGGRPELAAAIALFRENPWGFGAGVGVNYNDLQVAKAGMASINYDPNNGYVENYMFTKHAVEVHSVIGDLWASFGLPGLLLFGLLTWRVVKDASQAISQRTAGGLILFLTCLSFWNLFFSPFYSSITLLALCIGLIMQPCAARDNSHSVKPMSGQTLPLRYSP